MVSGLALALSLVPGFLFVGPVIALLVGEWEPVLALVFGLAAVAMPASGFPGGVVRGKSGLWTWRGRIKWDDLRGVGLARTFNVSSGSFEDGHLVPVLIVNSRGKLRWRVLRELRLSGRFGGATKGERLVGVLLSHGATRLTLPAKLQPFLL